MLLSSIYYMNIFTIFEYDKIVVGNLYDQTSLFRSNNYYYLKQEPIKSKLVPRLRVRRRKIKRGNAIESGKTQKLHSSIAW